MGQAKRRGTFEQRKAESSARWQAALDARRAREDAAMAAQREQLNREDRILLADDGPDFRRRARGAGLLVSALASIGVFVFR